MAKKVNTKDFFKNSMLSAIGRISIVVGMACDNADEILHSDVCKDNEFHRACFSAESVLWNVLLSHLEDMEQDLKEGVPLASHTYTYGYNISGLKNGKERK